MWISSLDRILYFGTKSVLNLFRSLACVEGSCLSDWNEDAGGGGRLPIMAIRGGSALKGFLFQASGIYEREGISLVEVHGRVGISVIWVCEEAQNG